MSRRDPEADRPVRIVEAHEAPLLQEVMALFEEYAGSLDVDLSFQGFEAEMAGMPGEYAPPAGALLLAQEREAAVGCVAMRPFEDRICEMKRMYIRPEGRGRGLGRILSEAIIERACRAGYARMRLDTLPGMKTARVLYGSLGFRPIAPYRYNPVAGTSFLELDLESVSRV